MKAPVVVKMTKELDLQAKTTKELEIIVANCVRLSKTGDARCVAASKVLDERKNGDYDVEKTIAAICDYGRRSEFLSYKAVADASGLEWSNVFRQINLHLDAVCAYSEGKGWPLLSALVVTQRNLASGEMTAASRKGFLDAAKSAGRQIDIEEIAFVKREQQRVFAWCREDH
jgi:hypothetical protein